MLKSFFQSQIIWQKELLEMLSQTLISQPLILLKLSSQFMIGKPDSILLVINDFWRFQSEDAPQSRQELRSRFGAERQQGSDEVLKRNKLCIKQPQLKIFVVVLSKTVIVMSIQNNHYIKISPEYGCPLWTPLNRSFPIDIKILGNETFFRRSQ